MHYHEREYDAWLCTRGKLRVWVRDQSRILRPGDFGVVAPGGWEEFMADAGEVWGMTALPPADRPFDFCRMGPAMAKHDVHPVPDAVYADASAMTEARLRELGDVDLALA